MYRSLFNGISTILRSPTGFLGLWEGALPTFIGYSFQGASKFGFYEYFKHKYTELAGPKYANESKTALYLLSSASAELLADITLAPWEALKVRMQTAKQPFASNSIQGLKKMAASEGITA